MSDLANIQSNLFTQIESDYNYFKELVKQNTSISSSLLLSLQKELEIIMEQARGNHSTLINTKKPSESVQKYLNEDIFTSLRRKFHEYWAAIEDRMPKEVKADNPLSSTIINDSTMNQQRSLRLTLPTLKLPTFDGNIRRWKTYYNSFMSLVDENSSIVLLDKMRYLVDSLQGDAKNLIGHLDIVEGNYDPALKLLKDRYDHKRILVNVQLNIIYNLEHLKKESSSNIRKTIDTVRECYQTLKVLGVNVKEWDAIIIFLVQHKLPPTVNQLWEEKLSNSRELPSFSTFEDFLECRFRTLDILNPSNFGTSSSQVLHIQNNNTNQCQLCNQTHFIGNCKQFLDTDPTGRYRLVIQNRLCINCLSKNHMLDRCHSKRHCKECPKRHHSLLHRDFQAKFNPNKSNKNRDKSNQTNKTNSHSQSNKQVYVTQSNQSNESNQTLDEKSQQNTSASYHIHSVSKNIFLLGTAVVQIRNDKGNFRTVRVLLDTGSEDNFIVESIVNCLSLPKYYCPSSISVIGGQIIEGISHRCDFTIKSLHNDFELKVNAGIKNSITPDQPQEPIPGICYNFLNNLKLADPSFDEPGQIHLLLGMGVWVQVVQNGLVKGESLVAQKTSLGWLVQGVTDDVSSKYKTKSSRCYITKSLENQIEKFWELEKVGNGKTIQTPDNILCEEIVRNSITQKEDGKLCVDLPFRNNHPPILGNSKESAKNRFYNLEKRLNQNKELKEEYHKIIQEYIESGHMKPISEIDCQGREYYLPHHAVFKASSSTTKVRVVFDASMKTSDQTSLNDHLLTGEKLQIDIRDILLRWRQYPIVFSADIEKMYRQFWINEKYHDYQRVFWRFSNVEPIKIYVLATVTFGTSAAPFLALRLLKYIANSELANEFPYASKAISEDFYVDDLMTGSYSLQEAIDTQLQLRNLLESFGLCIRKWCSNELNALQNVPSEYCEIFEQTFDQTDYKKTLGVYWSPTLDSFAFSVESQEFSKLKLTKRKTLSLIARLYDPLGWVGPCTAYAKLIMQKIWHTSTGWDDEIPNDIQTQFLYFLKDLGKLNSLSIPRWLHLDSPEMPITLLGFADASEVAYGCVVYLKAFGDQKHNMLLTSRSRVAPSNFTTIARLELCAALLLAEVLEWCKGLFSKRIVNMFAFSDSKIVLSWLQSHPSRWKTFVANRTSEILEKVDKSHWYYINTKENPADCISRGLLPSEIVLNELWWKGPTNIDLNHPFTNISEQDHKIMQHETKKSQQCFRIQKLDNSLLNYFSSNRKLFKRISSITKFIMKCLLKCCKSHSNKQQRYLQLIEKFQNPEHIVLRLVQLEHFPKETYALTNNISLPKDSKIRTLGPYIDGFGILRSGSRLENSEILSYDQKYPIILPSHCQFTDNIINEAHKATMHGGLKIMFTYIRNKYHIIKMKERINYFLRRCVNCLRYSQIQQNQLMGSLPFPRVNQYKPFLHTGVDFAGPILLRNRISKGSKTSKNCIAIFVCLCTKAIHIELVSDLSSDAFLASLRRFVYRRGRVQTMHSDCGTFILFKGASKTLQNECHEAQKTWKNLQPNLQELGISWDFNPPASPHFGGLWEAGVKSIKTHLNKTLRDAILTFEEYYTFLVQVEGILNSRPLCPISENPASYEALTPSHFLVGEPIVAPPEPYISPKKVSTIKRWRHIQMLTQHFWKIWRDTYLYTLAKRPKWLEVRRNFQKDDLVLVTEDNYAPTIWPLARITETHPGKDGLVRVVTLQTAEGKIFKRPIAKIRFLPITNSHSELSNSTSLDSSKIIS